MTDISVEIKKNVSNIDVSVEKKGGSSNYEELTNKPSINGVELVGNKTTTDLGIEFDTSNLATKDEIPTKTSQLENDSGFIKHGDIPSESDPVYTKDKPNIALKSEIPDVSGFATKEELNSALGDIDTVLDSIIAG